MTAIAAVEALRELGVGKVMVVTPYPDEPGEETELLQKYLEDYGFEVVGRAGKGLGKTTNREVGNDTPDSIYRFVVEHWNPGAEGLFVSCNWRALEIVDRLEGEFGSPRSDVQSSCNLGNPSIVRQDNGVGRIREAAGVPSANPSERDRVTLPSQNEPVRERSAHFYASNERGSEGAHSAMGSSSEPISIRGSAANFVVLGHARPDSPVHATIPGRSLIVTRPGPASTTRRAAFTTIAAVAKSP